MLVTMSAVEITTAPKGYKVAEVKYMRDGKEESRKIMSFAAKEAFAKLQSMTVFPVDVNIVMEKNAKTGYWDWKDIEFNTTKEATKVAAGGKVVGSNWETPEERARRQVMIVRQSSISNAIALLAAIHPKGIPDTIDVAEVTALANGFEQWVMQDE